MRKFKFSAASYLRSKNLMLPIGILVVIAFAGIGVRLISSSSAATGWQTVYTENWNDLSHWGKYDNPYRDDFQGPRLASNFTLDGDGGGSFARIWTRKNTTDDRLPIGDWASGGGLLNGYRYNEVKINTKIRLSKADGVRGVMLLWPDNGGWSDEIDFYEIGSEYPSRDHMKVSVHEPKQPFVEIYGKTTDSYPVGNHTILSNIDNRDYSQWRNVEVILTRDVLQVSIDGDVVYKTTDPSKIPFLEAPGHVYTRQDGSTYTWNGKYYVGMQTAAPGRAYPGHEESGISEGYMDVGPVTVSVPSSQIDNPPTVNLTIPADHAVVNGAAVAVAANAADDDKPPRVNFSFKAASAGTWTAIGGDDATPPYQTSWDTTGLANGEYNLRAIATDSAGQTTTSTTITVTVNNSDAIPPIVSMTVSPSTVDVGDEVTASATASDNVAVTNVEFYLNTSLMGSDNTPPYSLNWKTSSPGTKTLTAVAYDAAGNKTTSAPVYLVVNDPKGRLVGDVNGDGHVNVVDVTLLLAHYGQVYDAADFNKDGIVNDTDLSLLLGNWLW